jgi:NTE family protein
MVVVKRLAMKAVWMAGVLGLLAACGSKPVQTAGGSAPVVATSPVLAPIQTRPPRIGLALGGGAARGFAHVGVIQVLEQHGIKPDLVVGTSAGSLVAALYASGKNGKELEQSAMQMDEASLTDWTVPFGNRGMLRGAAVARYVSAQTQGRLIEDMVVPLGIVATDLSTGAGILFQRGDTGTAVRASSSVPGVFQPVNIGGRDYVDGGLVAPVPVAYAQQMGAELVIAVDISSPPEANPASDTLKVMLQTFSIMGKSINRHELKSAQVVVRPELTGVGSAAFSERQRSMAAGRVAMEGALPKLREQLTALAKPRTR